MTANDIATMRIWTQQIFHTSFTSAKEIVSYMGAMQAQEYPMAKWAVGIRLPNSTNEVVEAAINRGEIIRTHLMRPTWHFVSPEDIYWLLELTAPQIKSAMKSRDKELELTEDIYSKSKEIIIKALEGGKHLTREDLMQELKKAAIRTDENRSSHIMARAELDLIVCSGAISGNKQTYALLPERVPHKKTLTKEEALAELAGRYFRSHGPATLHDFAWWSGLSVTNARHGLEMVKSKLISETIDAQTYWFADAFSSQAHNNNSSAHLLPAFDEYIISYKDRSCLFPPEHQKRIISMNGIFKPVVLINGQIKGLWRRTTKKDKVLIEVELFSSITKKTAGLIEKANEVLEKFLGKKTEITFI